ncbi:ROK family protein [Microbacterium arborescens]|jgi:predicted NBD/HSP70 family sugar kinase|uniref:ROK family protein n=1 Tax=Microbacterium arborescens TaxID=33883 RepID=UPI0025A2164B|nr:ROK family protein [Microbacterium arborescens]WJM15668.1 ROK family protein [Microbacterium arborescens]
MSTTTMTTVAARPASHDAVLAFAWTSAEFTATDVIAATGLTRSTTIDALEALDELGLLRELPNARLAGDYRKGRPARRFALRDDAAVLVGVDAGHVHLTATVTDLRSRSLATQRATLVLDGDDAATRARRIIAVIDAALDAAGRTRGDVLAVCVGVPAPVDGEGHSPEHPRGFWARMNPGLVDELSWAPIVRVDNDASLAAVAEGSVGAAAECRDFIALLAGTRLGAGVVVDGNLLRGRHGGVGEMVAFDHVEGVGNAEGLGTRAVQWAREAAAGGELSPESPLSALASADLDARAVLELAARGDADALRIAERVGMTLARIVSVLGSMFDPQRVVVSGGISAGVEEVVAAARRFLPTDLDLPAPELVASDLGADVVVVGAVAGAAEAARASALDVWAARASASA